MMVFWKWSSKTTRYYQMLGLLIVLLLQCIPTQQSRVIPPIITAEANKVIAFREHSPVELSCLASGQPEPSYSWKKNGNDFNVSDLDGRVSRRPGLGTLLFTDPQQRDEGIYQCLASNQAGVALSAKIYFRRAFLEPFLVAGVRRHSPQLGHSLTLRCIPPRSYPQSQIFWAIIKADSRLIPLTFTKRVTMDIEGNLHFVNILPEDAQGGQRYLCIAQNSVMRSIQQGESAVITPQGHTIQRSRPNVLWQSPTHHLTLLGETLRLICIFSGSPTPRVDWRRVEGDMPSRARMDRFGMELVIDNVQFEDAGRYECQGSNDEGFIPVLRTFEVLIQAAPYWKQPMESQQAAEGDTVQFGCNTGGVPEPVNIWFINGRPITGLPSNPRMVIEPGKLTFLNVLEEDTKVIQCNSTNKHGYVWTNAYLSVNSEPPSILGPPSPVVKAAVGQTIQLPCKVSGSPKPQVSWTKDNQRLVGEKFTVLRNGSLEIMEVSRTDAGIYKCTAQNKYGIDSATRRFIVREQTRIVLKPRDRVVTQGTMVRLTCTAATDPDEVVNLRITWQRNGRQIDFQQALRITQNPLDKSLIIGSSIPLDTGNYTCVASNGVDHDQWTALVTIQGPPDPPSVRLTLCARSHAEITWQPGRDNNAPIRNFIIQFNTSFAPDRWNTVANDVPGDIRRRGVSVSPWGNYTFRVLARNGIGTSLPSLYTRTVCRTRSGRPYRNPRNVIGQGDQPGNLVIFWTPMPQLEWNGPGFFYTVTWQAADVPNAPVNRVTILDGKQRYYVTNIRTRPYAPFNIMVKAANALGEALVPPVIITGHAGEDHPVVAPNNLAVDAGSVTANRAVLTWSHVDQSPDMIRGFFMGYRIEFWRAQDNGENKREHDYIMNDPRPYPIPRRFRRDADIVRAHVVTLPAYSTVRVQVRVLNKYYAGPASDQIQFSTPEGNPGPPRSFSIAYQGRTYLTLEWAEPQEPNGIVVGYRITYQTVDGLALGRMVYQKSITNSETRRYQLTNLLPDTVYRINLSAFTMAGIGEPIYIQVKTRPPLPTTLPPLANHNVTTVPPPANYTTTT